MSRLRLLLALGIWTASLAAVDQPLQVPFFSQAKNGCGAASVAMLIHYWASVRPTGVVSPPPEQVYRQLYHAGQDGIALADMRRYLEGLGYRAFTLRGQWSDLEQHIGKGRPVIVALKRRNSGPLHFAVVTGLQADRVWLNDPTRKKANRLKKADFTWQWESGGNWTLIATPSGLGPSAAQYSKEAR